MQLQILSVYYMRSFILYYLHHMDKAPKCTCFLGHLPGQTDKKRFRVSPTISFPSKKSVSPFKSLESLIYV